MALETVSTPKARVSTVRPTPAERARFRFDLANTQDNSALQEFSLQAAMPGAIRFSFDRTPDYLAALCVEGRSSEVLVCRERQTGRLVATGHRSIKPAFINGESASLGYLSGLRVDPSARSAQLLVRGYGFLRMLHDRHPACLYLTTIMEDNRRAKQVLASGRLGLPTYHDLGRFCCVAVGLKYRGSGHCRTEVYVRPATITDGPAVIAFLKNQGHSRQFFPDYRLEDLGQTHGLLAGLEWKDIFLAFHGNALVGVLAAWDQRDFRRWRVTGYAPWLRLSRHALNLMARIRGMPLLPKPSSAPNYFLLALTCIARNDRAVFQALLEAILGEKGTQHSFFLAGLHEADPLLPELLARPHVSLPSRLYAVAWEDGIEAVHRLDPQRVPYLELGAL